MTRWPIRSPSRPAVISTTAREAIDHALRCPHEDILECANFAGLITARLAGQPLRESRSH